MDANDRNTARARRAGLRVRASGGSAIAAALAMIEVAFDATAAHVDLKARVACSLALGAAHPAVRSRFGARARLLGNASLDAAITQVECWHAAERGAGRPRLVRPHARAVLSELRLLLRYLRRRGMREKFPALVSDVR